MSAPSLLQVRASAGSGKTTWLTANYIDMLDRVPGAAATHAAGILAVTFTNAAADEMRRRVINKLKDRALAGDDASGGARGWLNVFFSEPGSLNIRTIDSFLHQIVRASALNLNISPDYETEFDVGKALAPHVDLLLEKAREPGAARERLRKACDAALDLKAGKGFLSDKNILKPIRAALPAALSGKFANLADSDEIDALLAGKDDRLACAAARLLDLAAENNLVWKGRWKGDLEKASQKEFAAKKPALTGKDPLSDLFAAVPPDSQDLVCKAFSDFCACAEFYYHGANILENAKAEKPFIDLALDVADSFKNDPLQRDLVLQELVSGWAGQILGSSGELSDALLRIGSNLTHLLVDEFQDTSREQWQAMLPLALEALSRGGSFAWVGDVKQSIYGWRGGDSGLFDEPAKNGQLTAVAGSPRPNILENNWRSLAAIVDHNNSVFAALARNAPEIAKLLLGKDAPADVIEGLAERLGHAYVDAKQKCAKKEGGEGFVCLEAAPGEGAAGSRQAIAERLVQILLDDVGKRRPWSDVLILVRSNDGAGELAKILGASRIPVLTENGLLLGENGLVLQSVAFLAFLDNRGDEISFWTVLRGSIFMESVFAAGLKDVDLTGWAAGRDRKIPLWRQFREDFPEVWKSTFGLFLDRPSLMTAYDAVMEWYRRMRVEQRFPEDRTMLRRFMEILHLAESGGMGSIAAFLEYWQENGEKEKAPMPETMNAVRVMTIHKAKGLEAPVVIVPGPDYDIKVDSRNFAILDVDGLGLAVQLRANMGRPYHEDMARQALEALNLLYVAFTRPREELYVIFPEKKVGNRKSTRLVMDLIFQKLGRSLPCSFGARKPAPQGHEMELMLASPAPEPDVTPEDDDWLPMSWLPRLRIRHAEPVVSRLSARQRGTIMHACLEFMDFSSEPGRAAEIALKNGLSSCGLAVPEAERESIREALVWFAEKTPAAEWMRDAMREQPLLDADGAMLQADLIVPKPWGTLVVDYKSGEPDKAYIKQLRKYMRALSRSGSGVVRGLIVYLDRKAFTKVSLSDAISLAKPPVESEATLVREMPDLP